MSTEPREDLPSAPADFPEQETQEHAPADGGAGRMVALPSLGAGDAIANGTDDAAQDKADDRAGRQMLTGRAARFALSATPLTPAQLTWRKLRKNKLAVAGGGLLAVLYAVALFAQFLAPYDYNGQEAGAPFRPPMRVHWTPAPTVYAVTQGFDTYHDRVFVEDKAQPHHLRFFARGPRYKLWGVLPTTRHLFGTTDGRRVYLLGTDQYGRDYLTRLLLASQISLTVGLLGIIVTLVFGLLVGSMSGYFGGVADDITMRLCEIVMSVPDFYLLLALAAMLPPTLPPAGRFMLIIAILSFVGSASMARIVRGMVLSVREREYVEAARALGVSDAKIILRHVMPSTFTFAIVSATLSIPAFILAEASLSYLGLGIRDPVPSWGNMLSAAQDLNTLQERLWLLTPGLMIFLTTLAFNFLGDGLRDALDPKSR